jgi:hypothetical protein
MRLDPEGDEIPRSLSATGRSVRLYLADGIPTGLVVAEIGNWNGKVLAAPRGRLGELLKRGEASRTGI